MVAPSLREADRVADHRTGLAALERVPERPEAEPALGGQPAAPEGPAPRTIATRAEMAEESA